MARDYSWLPSHQQHVAFTVAHADALIAQIGEVLFGYASPPGPLTFTNIGDGHLAHVTVTAVAPLPSAVSRNAAAALTQLRAAIEHTLFAEVEQQLGRPLSAGEGRRIEMPTCARDADLIAWANDRRRASITPLHVGAPLFERIRRLQPYQHPRPDDHPLRVLAEHTNLAKHRTPAVAATLLGAVIPDRRASDLVLASGPDKPLQAGDVLATGPRYQRIPLSIWPKISIQRPHTGTWHVAMTELGEIETWARTIALPVLIAGRTDVTPLPPQLDTSIGYDDTYAALSEAGTVPAAQRMSRRMQAAVVRLGIADTLALHPESPDSATVSGWLDALDDEQVFNKQIQLSHAARSGNPLLLDGTVRQLIAESIQHVTAA
ncbi:hypothetical protein Ait01nite_091200 [Actinoplanes italicus]|nr:hypothetical protein [Actinoplanes italicus]GIE36075.1 hypothetical protein Ait01nite_091200 [Actinoplanes italicus]